MTDYNYTFGITTAAVFIGAHGIFMNKYPKMTAFFINIRRLPTEIALYCYYK